MGFGVWGLGLNTKPWTSQSIEFEWPQGTVSRAIVLKCRAAGFMLEFRVSRVEAFFELKFTAYGCSDVLGLFTVLAFSSLQVRAGRILRTNPNRKP